MMCCRRLIVTWHWGMMFQLISAPEEKARVAASSTIGDQRRPNPPESLNDLPTTARPKLPEVEGRGDQGAADAETPPDIAGRERKLTGYAQDRAAVNAVQKHPLHGECDVSYPKLPTSGSGAVLVREW